MRDQQSYLWDQNHTQLQEQRGETKAKGSFIEKFKSMDLYLFPAKCKEEEMLAPAPAWPVWIPISMEEQLAHWDFVTGPKGY